MIKSKPPGVQVKTWEKLKKRSGEPTPQRPLAPIAATIPHERLVKELASVEIMMDSNPDKADRGFFVYRALGSDIPDTLLELGRLREETFRTVGEGSGLARDNDRFDAYYDHFIAWDKKSQEITGSYRIGRIDKILRERGTEGIYTATLFNLEEMLRADFSAGTLEAGRSFVRSEYQRGLTLLMLWMALSRFIAAHPEYKYLIGPVSISNEFQENSKHLMVSYLMKYHTHEKFDHVTSKNPPTFHSNLSPEELTSLVDSSINLASLQEFVRQAEGDPRAQIPQLIKLYLELGVRFLAFNKDDDFNSIDGLIWLDVTQVPGDIMSRYMGAESWATYINSHKKI